MPRRPGIERIRAAIRLKGNARIVLATGASQFATLEALVGAPGIDWYRVTAFHLDEYIGIGENGHLAFNDPPADFETSDPYIVVVLDERCMAQQLGEGRFLRIEEVPHRAISMSIRQIMSARRLITSVPDERTQGPGGPLRPQGPGHPNLPRVHPPASRRRAHLPRRGFGVAAGLGGRRGATLRS
jgi:hypothetical protein